MLPLLTFHSWRQSLLLLALALLSTTNAAWAQALVQEAENLPVVGTSAGDVHRTFAAAAASGGRCAILDANAARDYVTYEVAVPEARLYTVKVRVRKFDTRGRVQLDIAEQATGGFTAYGPVQDLYAAAGRYEELTIANVRFASAGAKRFRFRVVGKNAASRGYTLAVDAISLVPVNIEFKATSLTVNGTAGAGKPITIAAAFQNLSSSTIPKARAVIFINSVDANGLILSQTVLQETDFVNFPSGATRTLQTTYVLPTAGSYIVYSTINTAGTTVFEYYPEANIADNGLNSPLNAARSATAAASAEALAATPNAVSASPAKAIGFPNPFADRLSLAVPGKEVVQVAVYNASGVLLEQFDGAALTKLDGTVALPAHRLAQLGPGLYRFALTCSDGSIVKTTLSK